MRISNPSMAAGSTALDLQVETGKAPMKVDSGTKVTNLNADRVDGKGATALGVTMKSAHGKTGDCTSAGVFSAPITHEAKILAKHYESFQNQIVVTFIVTIRRRSQGMVAADEHPGERRKTMMKSRPLGRSELRDPGAPAGNPQEGGAAVQTGGVVQGVNTIPHSRWLDALRTLAFVAVVAGAMVLLVLAVPPTTGGVDTENAAPAAGSAVVHDDAGGVHAGQATGYAPVHDDAGNMRSGAGSAAVADGKYPETYYPLPNGKRASLNAGVGSAVVHDDAGSVNR